MNRKKDRNDFESYDEFFLKNDFENDEYAHFIHATFKLPKDAKESEIDNYVFTNPIVTKKTIPHEFLSSYVIQANKKEFCMKQKDGRKYKNFPENEKVFLFGRTGSLDI